MDTGKIVKVSVVCALVLFVLTIIFASEIKPNPGYEQVPTLIPEWIVQNVIIIFSIIGGHYGIIWLQILFGALQSQKNGMPDSIE